jgi:hypothetical protein
MTEDEWLACPDPIAMLEFVQGKVSDRKLRLFSCACHHRVWDRITDEGMKSIINMMEQFADGTVTYDEMNAVYMKSSAGVYEAPLVYGNETALGDVLGTRDMSANAEIESAAQAILLRDIFGNPFESAIFEPSRRTLSVVRLCQTIYEERTFNKMPDLGDALERAGCRDQVILSHCREQNEHVRGCWVVDLILGKE